ncbi:CPBP family intramembrane metalloprotease [Acidobacteria bacterium AB60]|nr:CPBP family intramembrane metalloprotease [Acidobacteria bacterium AB60]
MEPMDTNQEPSPALVEPAAPPPARAAIAPVWHTLLLVAGIVVLSIEGARELSGPGANAIASNRLVTYATTVGSELLMVAWIWFGLRLRKVPFRSLFGDLSGGVKTFFLDLGIAAAFWIGALMVLMTSAVIWLVADAAIHHRPLIPKGGKSAPVDPVQQHTVQTLAALAPSNATEIAAWALVCIMAGLIEELVFRGYLLRQFTAWSRGIVAAGVLFSSLMFGAAHGYQGVRNMVFLTLFGALFALLAVFRRNLRAGMFAHAWHDFFVGLVLALLKSKHLV